MGRKGKTLRSSPLYVVGKEKFQKAVLRKNILRRGGGEIKGRGTIGK